MTTQATIFLLGNCVIDQVWELEHYPQQDEEMRALNEMRAPGGNACNSAQILAKLGHPVELVSSLAQDSSAQWLLQQLSRLGVSSRFCIQKAVFNTPLSCIWLNRQNGSRTIVHQRNLPELSLDDLNTLALQGTDWIHFEGRNVETLLSYLKRQKMPGCPLSLEIEKDRKGIELLLPFVDTVIVSKAYLNSRNITAKQCVEDLSQYKATLNIVCTLGASGVVGKDSCGRFFELYAEKVDKVIDTVGAGDCFIAGLIHGMLNNNDFEAALIYASQLAARKIQFKGMRFDDE